MAVLPYEIRWPFRQVFEELRKGFPALITPLVTPLTLTVPHACVVTSPGVIETCVASVWPLAPAKVPGKNIANDASAATERRPAGSRNRLPTVLLMGARTPRMPT
jgi:hypothetical protein